LKTIWETVDTTITTNDSGNRHGTETRRLPVPGGWIYDVTHYWTRGGGDDQAATTAAVFVPTAPFERREAATRNRLD
jgi:hypothetical protein